MITTDNTTVVAYINKQAGTHSHTLLRLVVDRVRVWVVMHVFHINSTVPTNSKYSHPGQTHSWLFKCDSGLTISAKPVESPPGNSEPNIRDVGNSSSGHVCHSAQYASSPVYVSSSGASSTGERCSVTRLAGRCIHVSTIPPA